MKLKNILQETLFEDVEKLHEELESGKYVLAEKKLYRGMTTKIESFTHRSARKRREPQATTKAADTLINELLSSFFPSEPERRKSSFGSPSKSFASSFGPETNMIIPHKNAKVRFYDDDTWPRYTSNIGNKVNSGVRKLNNLNLSSKNKSLGEKFEKLRKKYDPKIIDFIYGVYEMKSYNDPGIFKDSVSQFLKFINLYGKLRSFTKSKKVKNNLPSEILYASVKFLKALSTFKDYVNNGHEEYHTNTREVIVEGDHLIVNPNWFNKHFLWNEGNVKLKNE